MSYRPKVKSDSTGTITDLALDAETVKGVDVVAQLQNKSNVGHTHDNRYVRFDTWQQNLTEEQKANARINIGAASWDFSYNDLQDLPIGSIKEIPYTITSTSDTSEERTVLVATLIEKNEAVIWYFPAFTRRTPSGPYISGTYKLYAGKIGGQYSGEICTLYGGEFMILDRKNYGVAIYNSKGLIYAGKIGDITSFVDRMYIPAINESDRESNLNVGSVIKPVYLMRASYTDDHDYYYKPCSLYAGGTAVTLNGTSKAAATASLYAPTSYGSSGQFLKANGENNAPTWANLATVATSGSYNDLTGVPIPGDSGEIKTKYRCAFKGYTGSGSPIWYYKLVKLPIDNSGNYASAIINGRIGGWVSGNMSSIYCLIWNRDGIGFALLDLGGTGTMSSIFDTADLVAYKNSDNTADIYIKCKGYFTFDLDVEVYQSSASITYDGTHITTTPSGTESEKASTSTSRLQLEKGVLKVNGEDVITSSKSAVDSGTDLSLVTTGEKYIWNNKQDKISSLGSTTKPVYFSSNGVASECSTYAGGTAVTLNGTSKSASTASFYAPTSVGTNGQLLSSNGSSLVWTNDNRSLLHHDLGVIIDNTTTDNGWSMFNSTYDGFLLKSVRFNANSPSWGVGDFGSGIVFGGGDTKGVVSVAYRTPDIKIAGGNGSKPVWWIGLTGTSGVTYDLDKLKAKPSRVTGHWTVSTTNPKPMVDIIVDHPDIKIYYRTYTSSMRKADISSVLFHASRNGIQDIYTLSLKYLDASGSLATIGSGTIYYEYFE